MCEKVLNRKGCQEHRKGAKPVKSIKLGPANTLRRLRTTGSTTRISLESCAWFLFPLDLPSYGSDGPNSPEPASARTLCVSQGGMCNCADRVVRPASGAGPMPASLWRRYSAVFFTATLRHRPARVFRRAPIHCSRGYRPYRPRRARLEYGSANQRRARQGRCVAGKPFGSCRSNHYCHSKRRSRSWIC